jgi:hypothetical protein
MEALPALLPRVVSFQIDRLQQWPQGHRLLRHRPSREQNQFAEDVSGTQSCSELGAAFERRRGRHLGAVVDVDGHGFQVPEPQSPIRHT